MGRIYRIKKPTYRGKIDPSNRTSAAACAFIVWCCIHFFGRIHLFDFGLSDWPDILVTYPGILQLIIAMFWDDWPRAGELLLATIALAVIGFVVYLMAIGVSAGRIDEFSEVFHLLFATTPQFFWLKAVVAERRRRISDQRESIANDA